MIEDHENIVVIPLTHGKFSIVDKRDKHFISWKWHFCPNGYARRTSYLPGTYLSGRKDIPILLHIAIMGRSLRGFEIDHINGNKLDNRRCNLRFVSHRENQYNTQKTRNGRLYGCSWHKYKKKWIAKITIEGKSKHLGYFKTEKEAHSAYLRAVESLRK